MKGGAEDNGCKWVKPSAFARVTCHIGPLSRGAAITNKIHHCVMKALVALLALLSVQSVVKYYILFYLDANLKLSHFSHLLSTFTH